jgi:glycerophosphoryl diester phosphodiesterase
VTPAAGRADALRVVAHRGFGAGHETVRENTPAACWAGRDAGADWVEVDARLAAEGALVCHHDEVLADGRRVEALTAAELTEAGVWLLGHLLSELPHDCGVNIECKPVLADAGRVAAETTAGLLAELAESAADDRTLMLSSQAPGALRVLGDRAPTVSRGLIATPFTGLSDAVLAAAHLGVAGVGVHVSALRAEGIPKPLRKAGEPSVADSAAAAREAGLWLTAWVVEPAEAAELSTVGIDAVVVDDVPATLTALGRG